MWPATASTASASRARPSRCAVAGGLRPHRGDHAHHAARFRRPGRGRAPGAPGRSGAPRPARRTARRRSPLILGRGDGAGFPVEDARVAPPCAPGMDRRAVRAHRFQQQRQLGAPARQLSAGGAAPRQLRSMARGDRPRRRPDDFTAPTLAFPRHRRRPEGPCTTGLRVRPPSAASPMHCGCSDANPEYPPAPAAFLCDRPGLERACARRDRGVSRVPRPGERGRGRRARIAASRRASSRCRRVPAWRWRGRRAGAPGRGRLPHRARPRARPGGADRQPHRAWRAPSSTRRARSPVFISADGLRIRETELGVLQRARYGACPEAHNRARARAHRDPCALCRRGARTPRRGRRSRRARHAAAEPGGERRRRVHARCPLRRSMDCSPPRRRRWSRAARNMRCASCACRRCSTPPAGARRDPRRRAALPPGLAGELRWRSVVPPAGRLPAAARGPPRRLAGCGGEPPRSWRSPTRRPAARRGRPACGHQGGGRGALRARTAGADRGGRGAR